MSNREASNSPVQRRGRSNGRSWFGVEYQEQSEAARKDVICSNVLVRGSSVVVWTHLPMRSEVGGVSADRKQVKREGRCASTRRKSNLAAF